METHMSEEQASYSNTSENVMPHLRMVDLNLLTVFDAVMQLQNITRAAQMLGMSQPAVSNAVARLKVMFGDELFVRRGRGIQPTSRAWSLFGSVRQALKLIQDELPGALFDPQSSDRAFNLCVSSPLDNLLTSIIFNQIQKAAPHVNLFFTSSLEQDIDDSVHCQKLGFVIGYDEFFRHDFTNIPLFSDEMVLVCNNHHPRINNLKRERDIYREQHAVVALDRFASFSMPWYDTSEKRAAVACQSMALTSALNVVSQTDLVAIVPRWLADNFSESLGIKALPLPLRVNQRTAYLAWSETLERDKGYQWMKDTLVSICQR